MFQIDLSSNGELLLILPTGRSVEITANGEGVAFIKKIVLDHRKEIRNQPAYIGTLPTQAACDKFLKDKKDKIAREKADETKVKASKLGIDLGRLEISL